MNIPSVDIRDMLIADPTFNVDFKFFLCIGAEPPLPIHTITIFDTSGFPPMLTYNREEKYEFPALQIRVRSAKYDDGWQIIEHIKHSLHGRANFAWNGAFYTLIQCAFGPFQLDIDNEQRMRFVINFNIQRREI
jgi:hypothetical protein